VVESDDTHDYGLATAHGLMDRSDCTVSDDGHDRQQVVGRRLSPDFDPDIPESVFEDWAVIKFERMSRPGLVRFDLSDAVGGDETITTAYIPKGRGLLVNQKPCPINYRDVRVPPLGELTAYPTHACRTQGGQSGTPMTVGDTSETQRLFGMNTGRTFFYAEWNGQGPRWYGRFIPLTPKRVGAIQREIDRLKVKP
jgi:hypothetical protein